MSSVDRVLLLASLLPPACMVVAVWAAAFRLRPEAEGGARPSPRPPDLDSSA